MNIFTIDSCAYLVNPLATEWQRKVVMAVQEGRLAEPYQKTVNRISAVLLVAIFAMEGASIANSYGLVSESYHVFPSFLPIALSLLLIPWLIALRFKPMSVIGGRQDREFAYLMETGVLVRLPRELEKKLSSSLEKAGLSKYFDRHPLPGDAWDILRDAAVNYREGIIDKNELKRAATKAVSLVDQQRANVKEMHGLPPRKEVE